MIKIIKEIQLTSPEFIGTDNGSYLEKAYIMNSPYGEFIMYYSSFAGDYCEVTGEYGETIVLPVFDGETFIENIEVSRYHFGGETSIQLKDIVEFSRRWNKHLL